MVDPLIDPVTGRVVAHTEAFGSEKGFGGLLRRIREQEAKAALPDVLAEKLGPTAIKGRRGMSSQVALDVLTQLKDAGHQFRAELVDNSALRVNLLHQGRSVGARFDMPLAIGGKVRGLPSPLETYVDAAGQRAAKRSEFIARGSYVLSGEGAVPATWMESVGHSVKAGLAGASALDPKSLREATRQVQLTIGKQAYENLVWAGYHTVSIDPETGISRLGPTGYQRPMGSPFDIFQMGVVGVRRDLGLGAAGVIEQFAPGPGEGFPFQGQRGQDFMPEATLGQIKGFLAEAERLGLPLSDEAIKAEAALAGNLGVWKLGDITPFGAYGDPARQAYQRLAIAPLTGRAGRSVPSVTTPVVEAMKQVASSRGGTGRFTTEARLALVLDPRFEQAVAGSAGGAVVSKSFLSKLTSDITSNADYGVAKWRGLIHEGGRVSSYAQVGTPLITSMGTKHTIASIQDMKGAQMAIGLSGFLEGKNPEAFRETLVRDVVDQLARQPRIGGRYSKLEAGDQTFRRSLLTDISKIFDSSGDGPAGTTLKMIGDQPQLQIGPQAEFGTAQLDMLNRSIDRYNQQLRKAHEKGQRLGLREIRKGFEINDVKIGGHMMRSMLVSASVMRRLEAQEVVTKAVGHWVRPARSQPGLSVATMTDLGPGDALFMGGDELMLRNRVYNPRGVKMGLSDLTNLELYKTKEATQLAEYYKKLVKNWATFEKREFSRAFAPVLGRDPMGAVGFPEFKGSISLNQFADKMTGLERAGVSKVAGAPAEQLVGTVFDAVGPFANRGTAINLGFEINIGGVPGKAGEILEGIPTRQIYMPAMSAYRGFMTGAEGVETGAYLDKLKRAHESLFFSLAEQNPDQRVVEAKARQYYNLLGQSMQGKGGLWSYMSTARMAQSGYLSLVPGGTGEVAQTFKSALENPYTVHISESTARAMGVQDRFKKKGKLYGRVAAYPGIGPTMESVLQFRMVKDSELGRNSMRISNLVALTMFRDFDADKGAVTFLTGHRAQVLSKEFYEKTVIPRLQWYEKLASEDKEIGALIDSVSAMSPEDVKRLGTKELLDYERAFEMAVGQRASKAARLDDLIAKKYGTKTLTGPLNWFLGQYRYLAGVPQATQDLERMGFKDVSLKSLGGVVGLIEQQVAITKAAGAAPGSREIFKLLGQQFDLSTQAGKASFEKAVTTGAGYLGEMVGLQPGAAGTIEAVAAGVKGRGEYEFLSTAAKRQEAMRELLAASQVLHLERARQKAGLNVIPQLGAYMRKKSEVEAGYHVGAAAMMDILERQAAASGDRTAFDAAASRIEEVVGISRGLDMQVGTDLAGAQLRKERLEAEALQAVNDNIKHRARAVGDTVLDRVSKWWAHADTPYWQKAGVITGAAILLGAVAKNTLMPGYGSGGDGAGGPAGAPVVVAGPPPGLVPSPPIVPQDGGFRPTPPHQMHKKPGGLWAYVSDQIGFGPESYGIDVGRGSMPMARPIYGPRKMAPGVGLDIGPGIADSDMRPMMLSGPPVGGGAPMPAAIPTVERGDAAMPYTTLEQEPTAHVALPSYMGGGMDPGLTIRAQQPAMGGFVEEDIMSAAGSMGQSVELVSDRWDPSDGIIDRIVDQQNQELSSFT